MLVDLYIQIYTIIIIFSINIENIINFSIKLFLLFNNKLINLFLVYYFTLYLKNKRNGL